MAADLSADRARRRAAVSLLWRAFMAPNIACCTSSMSMGRAYSYNPRSSQSPRPRSATRMSGALPKVALLAGAVVAAGAACVGYGVLVERDWYRLRRERVRALAPGRPPLTVLHLSDLHLTVADTRRLAFLERLAAEPVDLVVLTGDMLGEPGALGPVLEALGRFTPRLGAVAVLGSNDYWAPRFLNPLGYFRGPSSRRRRSSGRNPWRELVEGLEARGWTVLSNRRGRLGDVELAGMDDPHIRRDDPAVAVPAVAVPADGAR